MIRDGFWNTYCMFAQGLDITTTLRGSVLRYYSESFDNKGTLYFNVGLSWGDIY
jgi:hypothetical protein